MTTDPDRSYALLLPGELAVRKIAAALAVSVAVPDGDVDVAPRGEMERNWDAAALCTYEPVVGNLRWVLDVYLSERLESLPRRETVAAVLAAELGEPVLYEAQPFSETSYWLVTPEGWRTRARVEDVDDEEDDDKPSALVVTAVQHAVPAMPDVPVDPLPGAIRDVLMPTPVHDEWLAWASSVPAAPMTDGDPVWFAHTRLRAWEQLTVRMSSGWPPDGWYPIEYFRDDLETRDALAGAAAVLPPVVAGRFADALARVDEAFVAGTREIGLPEDGPRGWWWGRVPDPEPWSRGPSPGSRAIPGAFQAP